MMSDEEIKTLRHSFTNPFREDLPKPKKNQFGHTVLNSNGEDINLENFELSFDESGQVKAVSKDSWLDKIETPNLPSFEPKSESEQSSPQREIIPTNLTITPVRSNKVNIADLISELDEMDGTKQKIVDQQSHVKNCANENCLYALPKEATFCMKCGTYQAPKFCTECGYKFTSIEKFCPDCGNRR